MKNHPHFPFHIRNLDPKLVKLGIVECATHGLVTAYPVLFEKEGEFTAHVKFTVLLLPSGALRITGLPLPDVERRALKDESLVSLLGQSIKGLASKKKKKKKRKSQLRLRKRLLKRLLKKMKILPTRTNNSTYYLH